MLTLLNLARRMLEDSDVPISVRIVYHYFTYSLHLFTRLHKIYCASVAGFDE